MTERNQPATGIGGRSHLGAGSRITGELYFPGTVELPGFVKGRVAASTIVIEDGGEVEGEIQSANIAIRGRVDGQIVGGTVTLHATARVTGEITYESLIIESGAQFEGRCKAKPYKAGDAG